MAEALATEAPAPPPRRARSRFRSCLGVSLLLLLAASLIGTWGAMRWLDTNAGHRFLIRQIAGWQPVTGLRVTVGSIEGSVFKAMTLRDVRLADPAGAFAHIARADLGWYPLGWLSNRLDIDRLRIHSADLARLPRLRPGKARDSLLPGFDIRLADLRIDRLGLGAAVAGRRQTVRAIGNADIRDGRAVIALLAYAPGTADVLRLALDSRPDDRRFDIDLVLSGPRGGVIAGLLAAPKAVALTIRGDGDWHRWQGRVAALSGTDVSADLALTAQEGAYRLRGPLAMRGPLAPLAVLGGARARLDAALRFDRRQLSGRASLGWPAATLRADGGIDLARNRFDELRLEARVARPERIVAGLQGSPLLARARLAGPFRDFQLGYLLTTPQIGRAAVQIEALRVAGEGRIAGQTGSLPVRLTARALRTGLRPIDARLGNLVLDGRIQRTGNSLRIAPTTLAAGGLDGRIEGSADLGTGSYHADLRAGLVGLEFAGLGRVDVEALLRLARPAGGAQALGGTARATMRRLDNAFLRGLGQGLPVLTSEVGLAQGGGVTLRNLRLTAPALALAGDGVVDARGQLRFAGGGTHSAYGPLRLTLAGNPGRPQVDLTLASPLPALRLADVRAQLMPSAQGYDVTLAGGSMLGPFAGNGAILLPPGGNATIAVAALGVSEVVAKGDLVPADGGLRGVLALSGAAEGQIDLAMVDGVQRIGLAVDLGGVRFTGSPSITINRGTVRGEALLRPGAVTLAANAQGRGMRVGSVRVGRFAAAIDLVNGAGTATVSMNGRNGRLFELQSRATIGAGQVSVDLQGSIDQRPLRLDRAARFSREADGWRLAPVTLRLQQGALRLSGFAGASATHVDARMQSLPLALLDIVNSELGLGGTTDGTLTFDWPRGGVPGGQLALRVKGLTRSGLALSSAPIDIGVNAALDQRRLAARAVIAKGGAVVGRAQALVAPLADAGTLTERLLRAPLRAQFRYAGDGDTLWRLTNVEIVTLGGNIGLAADVGGTLADPRIQGTVTARGARIQSPVTGMALTNVQAQGVFDGSRLSIGALRGRAGGGTIAGTAVFDISAERGIGMDIAVRAERAVLLDRDDVGATVTGPLRLRSSGSGGEISGDLDVVASRFMLGRASAVAEIPQLRLVEINRSGEEVERPRAAAPWRLDVRARAARGLIVEGLGMQSEWSADLVIGGLATAPSFRGSATLIRGDYDFAGKRFDLEEGRLTFTGSTPVNPILDIRAGADVQDLSATITVTGTSLRPIVSFASVPAMPQDELLSRLLFGTSIAKLSAPEAIQLAAAVAALQGGGGLDPINAVRRATGLSRLRILAADTTTGARTSIAAGKNIGDNLYVELITDGQGYSATRIEYQITRWLSLISSVSTIGRQSVAARVSKDY